jgi:hypothetical protein
VEFRRHRRRKSVVNRGKVPSREPQPPRHGLDAVAVQDIDSHLIEPMSGRMPMPAIGSDAVLGQVIDRAMQRPLGGTLLSYLRTLPPAIYQGVEVTVAEMGSKRGIESSRMG